MKVLVTGSAGFIGFHLAKRLLAEGHTVLGFDGMTPFYGPALKADRHALLEQWPAFRATTAMLEDPGEIGRAVSDFAPEIVVHLAAQAGVRHGTAHPEAYVSANVLGTFNLLEALRLTPPRHLLIASTSAIYGGNARTPFAETDTDLRPLSLYGATKIGCEAMSHAYAHMWGLPTTAMRFFTAYGPWGRPDMALFSFVSAMERGEPITVYGNGAMMRDFTYVDDLVEAAIRLFDLIPVTGQATPLKNGEDSLSAVAPWRSVNIASGRPIALSDFIAAIEVVMETQAEMIVEQTQSGEATVTHADTGLLEALTGYKPDTPLARGVAAFVDWYREYYGRQNLA